MTVAAQPKISDQWLTLFKLLPGYDPCAQSDGYRFDEDLAERAVNFFPAVLHHTKGPIEGQPFELMPWQQALIGCLFGWVDGATGLRRYNECLLYVASKNGKSTLAAGILLYMLYALGKKGLELYSAASSREQGAFIYDHVVGFIKQNPTLAKVLKIYGDKGGAVQKAVTFDERRCTYRVLTADANTADGSFPYCSMIDELHRHKKRDLADLLHKKASGHHDPLTMYVTTADFNRESICNDTLKRAKQVRENKGDLSKPGHNPRFLPVIFESHREDDIHDPKTWRKSNPNMGTIIPEKWFAQEVKTATENPASLNSFLRLNLNIVTDADEAMIPMDQWDRCKQDFTRDDLLGRRCWGGLDLAKIWDLTALALVFPECDGESVHSCQVLWWFWVPKDNAHERQTKDRVPYETWARQGFIETTQGNEIDYAHVRADINRIFKQYEVVNCGVDMLFQGAQLAQELREQDGFDMIPFGQGWKSMTAPTTHLLYLIRAGRFHHNGNPVARWMASNVTADIGHTGHPQMNKKKSADKIDGIVAAVMGLGRAMVAEPVEEAWVGVAY